MTMVKWASTVTAILMVIFTAAATAEEIAITGATIHPAGGAPAIKNGTLLIRDGRIAALGQAIKIPATARVIDARGHIITPGLMSSETQIGTVEVSSVDLTDNATSAPGPFGAAFDVQYALNANTPLLPQARADGVTRAVNAPGQPSVLSFAGMGAVLRLVDGPVILDHAGAAMFFRVGGKAGGSRAAQWLYMRAALDEARLYVTGKNKHPEYSPLLSHVDVRALLPVLAGKMPLAIAANREAEIRQAVALATDYKIRVIILGGDEAWRAAKALAAADIPVVLDPASDQIVTFDNIGARPENALILHQAGVKIVLMGGTGRISWDSGAVLREGAGFAIAAGLPWTVALDAVTVNPAQVWGIGDRYGSLAPGKEADLVIWDGDPFQVTTSALRVFIQGQETSLVTRQTLLRDRYSPLRQHPD